MNTMIDYAGRWQTSVDSGNVVDCKGHKSYDEIDPG